jgi:hypothetical protein
MKKLGFVVILVIAILAAKFYSNHNSVPAFAQDQTPAQTVSVPIQKTHSYQPGVYNKVNHTNIPKLDNGLFIQYIDTPNKNNPVVQSDYQVPIIGLNGNVIWNPSSEFDTSYWMAFEPNLHISETTSGDLLYSFDMAESVTGFEHKVFIVGIHSDGIIFLKKELDLSDCAIRFKSPTELQIALQVDNFNGPESERYTGIWNITTYKIMQSGVMVSEGGSRVQVDKNLSSPWTS